MTDMMEAMPKKKPAIAIAIGVKAPKKGTFSPPKGYTSDTDDEVKEALLKFKELPDGTCEMISLDGAPFKDDMNDKEEEMAETPDESMMEDEMPADASMEDQITSMQKKQRPTY